MKNPIDKDKVAENPGILPYAHTIGSIVVNPEDVGKIKSRALSAMHEQTTRQLQQIQKQVEVLIHQANELKRRVEISEKIYTAEVAFEPFIGQTYFLYKRGGQYRLMLIGPDSWGKIPETLEYISTVKLLSDHTWEILSE
ncbi:hypothetical protein CNR22_11515 [Sphingobacteriaceae bacterium]|nr:hypothetical protein CNR22_11515 [Sphingobacteriaceae bacterium]